MRFILFGYALLTGCSTVVSVSQSDMTVVKGHRIEAIDEHTSVLNLWAPRMSTIRALSQKCPNGQVTGVETELVKREWVVVQSYLLVSQASCQDRE